MTGYSFPLREASGAGGYEVLFRRRSIPGGLALAFEVRGARGAIGALEPSIHQPLRPRPGEDLWRRTCFEAFLFECESERYVELNWNLVGEHTVLAFEGYRRPSDDDPAVRVLDIARAATGSRVESRLDLSLPAGRRYLLSPAAVLTPAGSPTHHYALAHGDRPDFHDREVVRGLCPEIG